MHTHIYIHMYMYIYIYIYISRPRGDRKFGGCFVWLLGRRVLCESVAEELRRERARLD